MNEPTSSSKPVTIAVIADPRYGIEPFGLDRGPEMAEVLLTRVVRRLNRLVRPDVTLVVGNLLDNDESGDAEVHLRHVRSILDQLHTPYIAIPGNHDGSPDIFYRIFTRPEDIEEFCGVRFVAFAGRAEPGANERRSTDNQQRLRKARHDHRGPIVVVQHVCLHPPDRTETPYNQTDAHEFIAAMKETNVLLSVSGHHHEGTENARDGNIAFVNAPDLCGPPFPFVTIEIHHGRVETTRHQLSVPENLSLFDHHVHTQLAYCSDTVTVENAIELCDRFGLAGITFTEHSGQLYFDESRYWDRTCFREGMVGARDADNRMADYLNLKSTHERNAIRFGLEVDCDHRGNLLLKPDDRVHFHHILGAIHSLPALTNDVPPRESDRTDFLFLLRKLLAARIDVLAHPFRVFKRSGWAPPAELFRPTAQLLREHDTPAEINFHTNEPPVEFIKTCLDLGVRFSLGSDAHHLAEIGDFACHLAVLADAGFDGDLSDILVQ